MKALLDGLRLALLAAVFVAIAANGVNAASHAIIYYNSTSAPSGWTCVSCGSGDFYYKLAKAWDSFGGTGGTNGAHIHSFLSSVLWGTANQYYTGTLSSGAYALIRAHTSGGLSSSVITAMAMPKYMNVTVMRSNTAGTPATLPAGAIVLFESSLPSAFTEVTELRSRFPRGANDYGSTGGSDTHSHTYSASSSSAYGWARTSTGSTYGICQDTHSHTASATSPTGSSLPSYLNVTYGKLNYAHPLNTTLNGMVLMFNDTPNSINWTLRSNSGNDYYSRFIRGAETYGATGGNQYMTHSHAGTSVASSQVVCAYEGTGSNPEQEWANYYLHDHTVTFPATSTFGDDPAYVKVIYAKFDYTPTETGSVCGTLNYSNGTLGVFTLANSVYNATGTCFTITGSNVTLDCNSLTVNYSNASSLLPSYGIISSNGGYENLTVRNCIINQTNGEANSHGVYLVAANNTLISNTNISVKFGGNAIATSDTESRLMNNTFRNVWFTGSSKPTKASASWYGSAASFNASDATAADPTGYSYSVSNLSRYLNVSATNYSGSAAKCSGSALICPLYGSQPLCESQLGCVWLGSCVGTHTPCSILVYPDQASCEGNTSCVWTPAVAEKPAWVELNISYAAGDFTGKSESNIHFWHFNSSNIWEKLGGTLVPAGVEDGYCSFNVTGSHGFVSQTFAPMVDYSVCGTLTSDYTLLNDVSSSGTCFTIGANNVDLDCAGYNITFGGGLSGYGVNIGTFTGARIVNCTIVESSISGGSVAGIYIDDGGELLELVNSTIVSVGASSYGLSSVGGLIQRVHFNTFWLNGSSANAVIEVDAGTPRNADYNFSYNNFYGYTDTANAFVVLDENVMNGSYFVGNNFVAVDGTNINGVTSSDNAVFNNNYVEFTGLTHGFKFTDNCNASDNVFLAVEGGVTFTSQALNVEDSYFNNNYINGTNSSYEALFDYTGLKKPIVTNLVFNEHSPTTTLNLSSAMDGKDYFNQTNDEGHADPSGYANLSTYFSATGAGRLIFNQSYDAVPSGYNESGVKARYWDGGAWTEFASSVVNTTDDYVEVNEVFPVSPVLVSLFAPENENCRVISSSGIYIMNLSYSATGTCLDVTAENVTIDCNGFGINYSNSVEGYGVRSNSSNTTVKNCAFINQTGIGISYSYGVFFDGASASNGTVFNNSIMAGHRGIYIVSGSDNVVYDCNVTATEDGVFFASSFNNSISNSTITVGGNGITFEIVENSSVSNSNVTASGNYGIQLYGASHNIFTDDTVEAESGIAFYSDITSINDTIYNLTFLGSSKPTTASFTWSGTITVNSSEAPVDSCDGIAYDCMTFIEENLCNSQKGCNWNLLGDPNCEGIHAACSAVNYPDASSCNGNLSCSWSSAAEPSGYSNVSKYLDVSNTTAAWVYLNVTYADSDVPSGYNASNVSIMRFNSTDWVEVAGSGVNRGEPWNYSYANLTSFSVFAPMAGTDEDLKGVTSIEWSAPTFADAQVFNNTFNWSYYNTSFTNDTDVDTCLVDLNGTNYTMMIEHQYAYYNFTPSVYGNYTAMAHCNTTANNWNSTGNRSSYAEFCRTFTSNYTLIGNASVNGANCFVAGANDLLLDCDGFGVFGNSSSSGFTSVGKTRGEIRSCLFFNFTYGAYLGSVSSHWYVHNNSFFYSKYYGLQFEIDSSDNLIYNNTFFKNLINGVYLKTRCLRNVVRENNVSYSSSNGIVIWDNIDAPVSTDNNITNNTVMFSGDYGIMDDRGKNNSIYRNLIFNSSNYGINLHWNRNDTVTENTVYYSLGGILFDSGGDNHTLVGNNFSYNAKSGVYIQSGNDNFFSDGVIANNTVYGIRFQAANKNIFNDTNVTYDNQIVMLGGGVNNFTNCSYNKATVGSASDGINFFWYATVHVINLTSDDVPNANVNISNVNGTGIVNLTTNATGWVIAVVQEYMKNATGTYNWTPHWFNASKAGYENNESNYTIDVSKTLTIVLGEESETISVTLNSSSVDFNPIIAGAGNTTCTNTFPLNITIHSETNRAVNVSVNASGNYEAGLNNFAIENLTYSNDTVTCKTETTTSFRSGTCGSYDAYGDWVNIPDPAVDVFVASYFWLQVPSGQPKDSYATKLYVKVNAA